MAKTIFSLSILFLKWVWYFRIHIHFQTNFGVPFHTIFYIFALVQFNKNQDLNFQIWIWKDKNLGQKFCCNSVMFLKILANHGVVIMKRSQIGLQNAFQQNYPLIWQDFQGKFSHIGLQRVFQHDQFIVWQDFQARFLIWSPKLF